MSIITIFLIGASLFSSICTAQTFTLMLDPAGDAKHAGRIIDDSFERGITLQCAERLKRLLEMHDPSLRVILTRFPGESLDQFQNANFANRLDVDLYISLHCYHEQGIKPSLFIFYFVNNPADSWCKRSADLHFEWYDKAHVINLTKTKEAAEAMQEIVKKDIYAPLFEYKGICGIPFKPLVGIVGPALGIEMSLKKKDQWSLYLEPIMQSIVHVISTLR